MKFNCPGCKASFSVPDDKIPKVKDVRLVCPNCRSAIELKNRVSEPDPPRKAAPPPPVGDLYPEGEEDISSLDLLEEGIRSSLMCVATPATAEKIDDVLRQMDYYISRPADARGALQRLQHNNYDLVIVDEDFGKGNDGENAVLRHISLQPMHARRLFFLCLLSSNLATFDKMAAFRMGVDMVLNVQDLEKAKIILTRAVKEHEAFYRLYVEELRKKGQ